MGNMLKSKSSPKFNTSQDQEEQTGEQKMKGFFFFFRKWKRRKKIVVRWQEEMGRGSWLLKVRINTVSPLLQSCSEGGPSRSWLREVPAAAFRFFGNLEEPISEKHGHHVFCINFLWDKAIYLAEREVVKMQDVLKGGGETSTLQRGSLSSENKQKDFRKSLKQIRVTNPRGQVLFNLWL